MGEKGFFVLFAIVIIAMFLNGVDTNLTGEVASETDNYQPATTRHNSAGIHSGSGTTISQAPPQNAALSSSEREEIKSNLEDLYDELWELEQAVDKAKRREPVSRYADNVVLGTPYTFRYSNSAEREHLILSVKKNSPAIDISDWYIESYVTDKRAAIPDGTDNYQHGGTVNKTSPIVLDPGQRAFLITGDSPINISFQENRCLGYAIKNKTFYPAISTQCDRPIDLLERYGDIELDDDSCYSFVRQIGRCETIDDDDPRLNDLSGKCERFVQNTFNQQGCIARFGERTDFDDINDWYIYFERSDRLWRNQREIIRLIDEHDEVVAVIEY